MIVMGRNSGCMAPFRRVVRAFCLGACMLVVSCAVNPVTHERQFVLMSEAQEVQVGDQAYPVYTQASGGLFQDPGLQAYVQSVGGGLAELSHRPGLDYQFNVVNASEINAYALPGGKISITRGLLSRMENEAQLASVLGHEIGHVAARHSASGYTRQVLAGILTAVGVAALEQANITGGDLLAQGGILASNLVLMKYSRDQERQSDELGMEYMARAGYNPEGMVQTMKILMGAHDREPSAVEGLFMSHPLTSERVNAAERMAARQAQSLMTPERLRAAPFARTTAHLREVGPAYAKMDQGREALSDGRDAEAVNLMAEACRMAPGEAQIWVMRAAAEAKVGDTESGFSSAQKALELYPDLYQARVTAGILAFELGKGAESLDHLQTAERLVPGQPAVMFFIGRNYETAGRREDAAKAYSEVLQKVNQGSMAEYCHRRLVEWGYIKA
jgi:predicted Zn-dependent protease